eukprot:9731731-Lingulodinium_polyedra.AAC.1
MEDWAVWGVVDQKESFAVAGEPPLKGRWVDCNKGAGSVSTSGPGGAPRRWPPTGRTFSLRPRHFGRR